ncbi:hypothetical protein RND71_005427 [Anisodus tanguticus]|uniref:Auxin-responsive protein n=1 Tax=Anisodus tanguticus TaxID=243964 RepID=A0AAE1SRZ5_9SOLA|nr:hypothetical protein RND71_005427 [Anisodus tanguticus]
MAASDITEEEGSTEVAQVREGGSRWSSYLRKVELEMYTSYDQLLNVLPDLFTCLTICKYTLFHSSSLVDTLDMLGEEPLLIRRDRRRKVHDASLHAGGTSSLARPSEHLQDSLSASLDIRVSSIEAIEEVDVTIVTVGGNPTTEVPPTDGSEGNPDNQRGVTCSKASLLRLLRGTTDSPTLAATYNDMALALTDLFALHRTTKDSHDESLQLDNKIQELGNHHVVLELDQRADSKRLAKLEDEWNVWKNHLIQAMPIITSPPPADLIAELSADTLMDLPPEAVVASVDQEVSTDTQAFTEAPSTIVVEPLLGAEREVHVGVDAVEQKLKASRSPEGVTGYGVARISSFFSKLMWSEGFTIVGSPIEHARQPWPKDYKKFCEVIEKYEKEMEKLAGRLMWLMLGSLGITKDDVKWAVGPKGESK